MSLELRNGANVVDFGHFIGFGDIEQKKKQNVASFFNWSPLHLHFLVLHLGEPGVRLWDQTCPLYGFDHDERRGLEVSYL